MEGEPQRRTDVTARSRHPVVALPQRGGLTRHPTPSLQLRAPRGQCHAGRPCGDPQPCSLQRDAGPGQASRRDPHHSWPQNGRPQSLGLEDPGGLTPLPQRQASPALPAGCARRENPFPASIPFYEVALSGVVISYLGLFEL